MATADHANDLAERLRNGDIDPAEIDLQAFIDDDLKAMTPELWQELDEDQRERYNELRAEADREVLEDRQVDRAMDSRAALDRLRDPDATTTDMARLLTGPEIEVKTHTNANVEEKIAAMDDADTPAEVREEIIDVVCWFVVDDELADRELWEDYAAHYGTGDLMKEAMRIMEPWMDSLEGDEVLQKFRA